MRKKPSLSKDSAFVEDLDLDDALRKSGIPAHIHRFIQKLFHDPGIRHWGAATPPSSLMKIFMGTILRCIDKAGSPHNYDNCTEIAEAVREKLQKLIKEGSRRSQANLGGGAMKYAGASFVQQGSPTRRKGKNRRDTE